MRASLSKVWDFRYIGFVLVGGLAFAVVNIVGQIVAHQLNPAVPVASPYRFIKYFLLGAIASAFLAWGGRTNWAARRRILPRLQLNLSAFAIFVAAWLIPLVRFWPAVAMNDSWAVFEGPLEVSNQHPLGFGIYLTGLTAVGEYLFGSQAGGIAFASVVQVLLWAAGLVYVVDALNVMRVRTPLVVGFIIYAAFFPVVSDYAIALVKDSPFMLGIAMLSVMLVRIFNSRGKPFTRPAFVALFVVVLVVISASRNNGTLLVLIALVCAVGWAKGRRKVAALAGIAALVIGSIPAVISSHYAGPHKYAESVGVPLQMIGYTIKVNRGCLPPDDLAFYSKIFPLDLWAHVYDPVTIDSVKYNPKFQWGYIQEHKEEFPKHFLSSALSCPRNFARAYINHTYPYWTASGNEIGSTTQSTFTQLVSNETNYQYGYTATLRKHGVVNQSQLPQKADEVFNASWLPVLKKTRGTGAWMWGLVLICVAALRYGRRGVLVSLLPSAVIMGTLFLASPHSLVFRYSAFLTLTVPLALLLLFSAKERRKVATPN